MTPGFEGLVNEFCASAFVMIEDASEKIVDVGSGSNVAEIWKRIGRKNSSPYENARSQ